MGARRDRAWHQSRQSLEVAADQRQVFHLSAADDLTHRGALHFQHRRSACYGHLLLERPRLQGEVNSQVLIHIQDHAREHLGGHSIGRGFQRVGSHA